ncbi:hypothetical protein [Mesorhizobium captivum]|uniref:hypothetical protein n=1 Tax=Mesorhizobium captivum TaxID=3072319 RepID=UPI002A246B0D|nr:hypothetical protein [Mesorhizobium sp. VK23E]MDX8513519.1 hypothetical protein [Mesorhizobium sp. VK23E]
MVEIQGFPDPWRAGRNSSGARISLFDSTSNGDAVLKRALSKVKPDEGGEAHTRFGKASRFTQVTPDPRTQPSVEIIWPPDEEDKEDEPKEVHIIEYDEVFRKTETIRVENPEDSEQYVMVKNVLRIIFVGRDDGLYRGFNLKPASELD